VKRTRLFVGRFGRENQHAARRFFTRFGHWSRKCGASGHGGGWSQPPHKGLRDSRRQEQSGLSSCCIATTASWAKAFACPMETDFNSAGEAGWPVPWLRHGSTDAYLLNAQWFHSPHPPLSSHEQLRTVNGFQAATCRALEEVGHVGDSSESFRFSVALGGTVYRTHRGRSAMHRRRWLRHAAPRRRKRSPPAPPGCRISPRPGPVCAADGPQAAGDER